MKTSLLPLVTAVFLRGADAARPGLEDSKNRDAINAMQVKYATALDTGTGATFAAFKANSYPDYYIIDRKGNLRWGDLNNRDVEAAIKLLIAEKE